MAQTGNSLSVPIKRDKLISYIYNNVSPLRISYLLKNICKKVVILFGLYVYKLVLLHSQIRRGGSP